MEEDFFFGLTRIVSIEEVEVVRLRVCLSSSGEFVLEEERRVCFVCSLAGKSWEVDNMVYWWFQSVVSEMAIQGAFKTPGHRRTKTMKN